MFLLLFVAVILPYRMAFYEDDPSVGWVSVWLIINVFFVVDLIITFFTTYTDSDNQEVTSHKRIAIRYLKGWFIVDIISCLPFDVMISGQSSFNILPRILRVSRIYKLIRLLRILKILKLVKSEKKLSANFE